MVDMLFHKQCFGRFSMPVPEKLNLVNSLAAPSSTASST